MPFRFLCVRHLTTLLLTPAALVFAASGTVASPVAEGAAPLVALNLAPECVPIQNDIDGVEAEIESWQEELSTAAPGQKPAMIAAIRRLNAKIHTDSEKFRTVSELFRADASGKNIRVPGGGGSMSALLGDTELDGIRIRPLEVR